MKFFKRAYQVLLPVSVLVLGFLLYCEYQTRELAVTGARIDTLELHLRNLEMQADVARLPRVQEEVASARKYFAWAIEAYRKRDFRIARIHIHNTMWDLDIATRLLRVDLTTPKQPEQPELLKPDDGRQEAPNHKG